MSSITSETYKKAIKAIDLIKKTGCPIWKSGKAIKHLEKRISVDHLPQDASMYDYEKIIMNIVGDGENELYLYWRKHFNKDYFVVGDRLWVVIFGEDSIMETAFRPDSYVDYLKGEGYEYIGTVKEARNR